MATVKKDTLAPAPQWWKHLKWCKRQYWKRERQAEKNVIQGTKKEIGKETNREA